MSLATTCAITIYQTPDDADTSVAAIIALLDGAATRIRVMCYGFNRPAVIDAIVRAHSRGIDVKLCLDHTQAAGPVEVAQLHRLFLAFPPANVRIGTSPVKHQILHRKAVSVDGVRAATGSLNWTNSGPAEANDLVVFESPDVAAAFEAEFDELWRYIDTNEASYQMAS